MEKTSDKQPPEVLYHYTSLECLHKILSGITVNETVESPYSQIALWATHTSFLNDLNEGRLLPKVLKRLGINDFEIKVLSLLSGYPFVVSLSCLKDDLNMWRCYGNDGRGVAIGFDYEALAKISGKDSLDKCEYVTEEELKDIIKKEYNVGNLKKSNVTELGKVLYKSHRYKDNSFEAESEWRLFVSGIETAFRMVGNVLTPYREIKIPVSAIKSITFGPKCDFNRNKFSVGREIHKNTRASDFIEMNSSNIPLR